MASAAVISALITADQVMKAGNETLRNLRTSSSKETVMPFHCNLARSMGNLSETFQQMDDKLKIIISTTNAYIAQLIKKSNGKIDGVSWDEIVGAMNNNPSLHQMEDEIHRSDKLIKDSMNDFKFDGSPDSAIVNEVHTWFVNLVKDEDILHDLHLDLDALANIVAWTGATITNVEEVFYKKETHEQHVMEIGILRYPDIDHPYFKLYRIVLKAWSTSERVIFHQHDKNGITGTFTMRKFEPRDSVINGMREEVKQKAISEVEAMILGNM